MQNEEIDVRPLGRPEWPRWIIVSGGDWAWDGNDFFLTQQRPPVFYADLLLAYRDCMALRDGRNPRLMDWGEEETT